MICNLCPRRCSANRNDIENNGFCEMPSLPKLARAGLHFWEEPCISGKNGSGTIFFSGCNLKCVYCQNFEISHKNNGKTVPIERLAEIFKELEEQGAHNINLVNPSHYIGAIKKAISLYKPSIPIVYNSSGYDSIESVKSIVDDIDIFLVDIKYLTPQRAEKYSKAADYPEIAANFVKFLTKEVVEQNVFDSKGILKKGIIIRHLILPQGTNEAIKVIDFINENCNWIIFSLMSQYLPFGDLKDYPELNRKISKREYQKVLSYLNEEHININNIYTQELSSSSIDYVPEFNLSGI